MLAELDRLAQSGRSADEIGRDEIVESVARAALLGARGNSGVILSQLIRGAAEELVSRPGELVDPVLIGAAMARAADRAYASVRDPAEGTILTVVREMAHRVASELAHMPRTRLEPDASAAEQDARHRRPARARRRRRPRVGGPVARAPGRTARGGRGGRRGARGDDRLRRHRGRAARAPRRRRSSTTPRPGSPSPSTGPPPTATAPTSRSAAVELDATELRSGMEALGDSVLVVGDQRTLKVHVHTDEPERATELAPGRRPGFSPRRGRHARAGARARAAPGLARRRPCRLRRGGGRGGRRHAGAVRGAGSPRARRPARRSIRQPWTC